MTKREREGELVVREDGGRERGREFVGGSEMRRGYQMREKEVCMTWSHG